MSEDNVTLIIRVFEACFLAYLTYAARKNQVVLSDVATRGAQNGEKIDVVHQLSNSRLTAMQDKIEALTSMVAHLEGKAAGVRDEKKRIAAAVVAGELKQELDEVKKDLP